MDTFAVTPQPVENIDVTALKKSNKRKLTWGLVCLLGPTALIVISLLFYAITNFIFASSQPDTSSCSDTSGTSSLSSGADISQGCQDELFGSNDSSAGKTIVNVILFLVGAVSVLTMLPGFIVGIILLATRKPVPPTA